MALPIVSKETCLSVAEEIASDRSFLTNFYERLKKTNPQIVLLVAKLMKITGNKKNVLIVTATIYRMLEIQEKADNLKKDSVLK